MSLFNIFALAGGLGLFLYGMDMMGKGLESAAGSKLKGVLSEVSDDTFTIKVAKKVKPEGAKRPVIVEEDVTIKYSETKYTKYLIQFK